MKLTGLIVLAMAVFTDAKGGKNNDKNNSAKSSSKASADTMIEYGYTGDECIICDKNTKNDGSAGRPDSLTFEYNPIGLDSAWQPADKASCVGGAYPPTATLTANGQTFTVSAGDTFTVNGPFESAEMDIDFGSDSASNCFIHVSCSVPIVISDQIGPLIVKGPDTCNAVLPPAAGECVKPGEECSCQICDSDSKENKPMALTLQYLSSGVTSTLQGSKATCTGDLTYPETATLELTNKDGAIQTFTVSDGDFFTIEGPFNAESSFTFVGATGDISGQSCFIHTSCSVPLVAGDQIGMVKVISGGDCDCTPCGGECVAVELSTETVCEDAPFTATFDFAGVDEEPLPDDWIGIYPCDAEFFLHATVWQWTCEECLGTTNTLSAGSITFDSLPVYNQAGPHKWPVAAGCYKPVLLRNDGPSVPPYVQICEGQSFNITECA